jgi:hypothetical protein
MDGCMTRTKVALLQKSNPQAFGSWQLAMSCRLHKGAGGLVNHHDQREAAPAEDGLDL